MAAMRARKIYEEYVKPLPPEERLQLMALMADELALHPDDLPVSPQRDIQDLHGLGQEIWQGVDAQQYVDELREEWEHRP